MRRTLYPIFLILFLLCGCTRDGTTAVQQNPPQSQKTTVQSLDIANIKLPTGFHISMYAQGLQGPRFMTLGPNGTLLVANRGGNSIIALPPGASSEHAGNPITIVSGLDDPTSIVMHDGYLYIGEAARITRIALSNTLKPGPIEHIIDLPRGGQHSTRTVLIGPDNHIYVSIGSTCNVCIEKDPHRAAIWIYNMDGSHGRLYAKGLRNAVGMAINPWNKQIWADVNGRDLLGDDLPPETLYDLIDQGDYGWPRCHAGELHDPDFGQAANSCQGVQKPLLKMQAHSAPLGLDFYPTKATQFPEPYRNSLYIAFHGSWNRTSPTGYKVIRVPLRNGSVAGPAEDFITGWLQNGAVSSRPVGITFAPDGTMFVSDDKDGIIYHVWYAA